MALHQPVKEAVQLAIVVLNEFPILCKHDLRICTATGTSTEEQRLLSLPSDGSLFSLSGKEIGDVNEQVRITQEARIIYYFHRN